MTESQAIERATNLPQYTTHGETEGALLHEIETVGAELRNLVNRVERFVINRDAEPLLAGHAPHSIVTSPGRWLGEGRTDLQKGLMCLERAVKQPVTF